MSEQLEYMKAYHRCQFMYFNSRLDYICENQAKLMRKAHIPVPMTKYVLQSQFDKDGHLLTSDWSRVDPTLTKDKELAEEDKDDEDEEGDEDEEDDEDAEEEAADDPEDDDK
ncbi:hypothetical protein KSP39_PZI015775 [Platanthera zijinensis]|uniref:Uncharacterized protein n=1 Tax=Platanthera zijinensis TaxID=2320716 RepID=A0AAP0G1B2_9ASPA